MVIFAIFSEVTCQWFWAVYTVFSSWLSELSSTLVTWCGRMGVHWQRCVQISTVTLCFLKYKLLKAHHALKIPGNEFSWTTWNTFGEQVSGSVEQKVVPIHLLIVHCFISLQYSQSINDCIIFWHFFSVGMGNELLRVCYNFNYPIQCTKLILTYLWSELKSVIEINLCVWRTRTTYIKL